MVFSCCSSNAIQCVRVRLAIPLSGVSWRDGKTVIRGGVGVYYDFQSSTGISDEERVSLGPRGVGRGSYYSGGIRNPLTDVPGLARPYSAFMFCRLRDISSSTTPFPVLARLVSSTPGTEISTAHLCTLSGAGKDSILAAGSWSWTRSE